MKQAAHTLWNRARNVVRTHKRWLVPGAIVASVGVYGLLFFVPKPVAFAYQADTCVRQLTLFPLMQQGTSEAFTVKTAGELKIGSITYAATKLCVSPSKAPTPGTYTATNSPFGSLVFAKRFAISVPEAPKVQAQAALNKPISAAVPLKIKLSQPDTVHTYLLKGNEKSATCTLQDDTLQCPVDKLALVAGTSYAFQLDRQFAGENSSMLYKSMVKTLDPLVVTQTDLADGKTIYDLQNAFAFTFDADIQTADVSLTRQEGEITVPVPVKTDITGNSLRVTATADLPRSAQYTLTLKQVIATSGKTLSAAKAVPFSTSGGPKVSSVSVGSSGVGQNATIVLSFDQPISDSANLAQLARIEGVSGTVAKRATNELVFGLQNAPLCANFTLKIDKGLPSGSNKEVSEAYSFASRTVCGTSSVIGYSVKGRPIVAHYFGNGASTVLFTAGIHGSEPSSTTTMQAWVDYLMANAAEVIPAGRRVVIVPNTNPDAIAAGSRNNASNVNVGRNFPTNNWKADIETTSGVLKNGGGMSGGSEPEAKALLALTRQLRPRLEVSFHAQGRLVGANKFGDSVAMGDIYARTVGYQTMFYDAEAVMGYPMTGEYEDWMGEELGTPAILIELPTNSGNYLSSQLAALKRMLSH